MLYWAPSLLLCTVLPLTRTCGGKIHSNQFQRSLSNTNVWSSVKKERPLFVLHPSILRGKRLRVIEGLNSEEQHNLSSHGLSCFMRCGRVGRRHKQSRSVRSSRLTTDVTLAPHAACAAWACKCARAGYNNIPQGEGKAPVVFKPQLLHHLYSGEKPLVGREVQKELANDYKFSFSVLFLGNGRWLCCGVSGVLNNSCGASPYFGGRKETGFLGRDRDESGQFQTAIFPTGSFCSNHKLEKLER